MTVNCSPQVEAGSDALQHALAAWRAVLGEAFVRADDAILDHYSRTTSAWSRRPAAVLQPATTDEVAALVRVARQYRTPLYPISTGLNWGYGDACAVFAGQVVVDLRRMNRIQTVDPQLGYAVIEPGVTQQQLADYLAREGVPFWTDCTGASPHCSFIGNILERGSGHTPYGNRIQTVSGLEVVLGSGEVLHTGFGHYPNAKTTYLYPYGTGPYLDGIFTQSNFGIVTRLGLWLLPIPESFCPFLVLFREDDDLFQAIEPLQKLRLHGILHSVPHIGNDLRLLAANQPFPRDRLPGMARLTPEVRAQLRREAGIGAWAMSGAFYGPRHQVALHRRLLKRALAGVSAKVVFLPGPVLALGHWFAERFGHLPPFRGLAKKVRAGAALAGLHSGQPTGHFLRGSYWRHRSGIPVDFSDDTDLARDGVGLLWMVPIIPFRQEDLQLLNHELETLFAHFEFDCHATMNMINERALAAVYTIEYDAADAAETERALACYEAGIRKLYTLGYPLYRSSPRTMALLALEEGVDEFWRTAQQLKDALDPDGIIAPGRYQPGLL